MIDIPPNASGLPGIEQLRVIVGAVMVIGLILAVLALIIAVGALLVAYSGQVGQALRTYRAPIQGVDAVEYLRQGTIDLGAARAAFEQVPWVREADALLVDGGEGGQGQPRPFQFFAEPGIILVLFVQDHAGEGMPACSADDLDEHELGFAFLQQPLLVPAVGERNVGGCQ